MKKYYILLLSLFVLSSFASWTQELKNKVTIYNFVNKTAIVDEKVKVKTKGKAVKPKSDEALFLIIPLALSKEFTQTGRWEVTKNDDTIQVVDIKDPSYPDYVNSLKAVSETANADYLVTGMYRIEGKTLTIESHLYIARLGQIIIVNMTSNAGALIADVVGKLSDRINSDMDSYLSKLTLPPVITPKSMRFDYAGSVKIEAKSKDTVIYYTTNGSDPVPNTSKAKVYKDEIKISKDTEIKALAVKKNFSPSQIVTESYRIRNRHSAFEVDILFGSPVFMGSWGDQFNTGGADWMQLRGGIDFYTFDALSGIPVVRDMSFVVTADLGKSMMSTSSTSKTSYYYYAGAGAFAYKIRFGSFFELEPSIGAGAAHIRTSDGEKGFPSYVYSPPKKLDSTTKFMYVGALTAGIAIGDWRILAGVSYKTVQYSSDPMKIMVYQMGIGYRF